MLWILNRGKNDTRAQDFNRILIRAYFFSNIVSFVFEHWSYSMCLLSIEIVNLPQKLSPPANLPYAIKVPWFARGKLTDMSLYHRRIIELEPFPYKIITRTCNQVNNKFRRWKWKTYFYIKKFIWNMISIFLHFLMSKHTFYVWSFYLRPLHMARQERGVETSVSY